METEVLLKLVEGSSAITLLAIGILYLLIKRRSKRNGDGHMTRREFENTVLESRRLSDAKHMEVIETLKVISKQAASDRQNLYDHASDHSIHQGGP